MQKLKKEVVMMSIKQKLTGKPSIDRPWMQYYPQEMIENLTVPNSTLVCSSSSCYCWHRHHADINCQNC